MGKKNANGYVVLTLNLKADDPAQYDIWQKLEDRVLLGVTMSDVIRELVAQALGIPAREAPAISPELEARLARIEARRSALPDDMDMRLAAIEAKLASGIALSAHERNGLTDIVDWIKGGRPAPVLADDFKRE